MAAKKPTAKKAAPKVKKADLTKLTDEHLVAALAENEAELDKLRIAFSKAETAVRASYERVKVLREESDKRKYLDLDKLDPKTLTQEQWDVVLDPHGGELRYRLGNKVIEGLGLYMDGYNPATNQRTVRTIMYRDEPASLTGVINGLSVVLPFIKTSEIEYFPEKYGEPLEKVQAKYFSLLDRGSSMEGIKFFIINEDEGIYWAMLTRYSRTTVRAKFATLDGLVGWMHQNDYYKRTQDGVWGEDEEESED
jgi:hypothetical protein